MDIWIATNNSGKLLEFQQILQPAGWNVRSQRELDYFSPPAETGQTFEENARIKARALHAVKNNNWVLADDSGLEVTGLGGLPGIHSARYAGPKATDPENCAKLLKMLQLRAVTDRRARFRCCLVVYSPSREESVFVGQLEGRIAPAARGTGGFGYDPVFIPSGEDKTLAELGVAYKNTRSHRAEALRSFVAAGSGLRAQ